MTDTRPDELRLADQECLTEDARECARVLFERLSDEQLKAIIDDPTWEWAWLLWSPVTQLPPWPPSVCARSRRRASR